MLPRRKTRATSSEGTSATTVQPNGYGNQPLSMRKVILGSLFAMSLATNAVSATFGTQLIVQNVKVQSIFRGSYGPTYVTFSPSSLAGCNGNYGGYLSATWPDAIIGWPIDSSAAGQLLSLLMLAKATDAPVEVRYRVNTTGTGWDKCAIDSIWVQ